MFDKLKQLTARASSLYVTLPPEEVGWLSPVVSQAMAITASANEMLQQFRDRKEQAALFAPVYAFLRNVEGYRTQSYTINGRLTIGIGFDITAHSDSELGAIFSLSLDPSRKWTVADLRTENWPSGGLSDTEISSLLLNALIGVEQKFVGSLPKMIEVLQSGGFSDTTFLGSQLIALLSMVYNNPILLGVGALSGLQFLQEKGSDIVSLIDIVESSNSGLDFGLQNRRLKEAALFHSNPTHSTLDVHLTWRQHRKLGSPQIDKPAVWGLPSGEDQTTFVGKSSVEIIPGQDKSKCGIEVFGTSQGDMLSSGLGGSPVFYGGDGDDLTEMTNTLCSDQSFSASYYAGGMGYDIYSFKADGASAQLQSGSLIYDSDNLGQIIIDGQTMEGALVVNSAYAWLSWDNSKYRVTPEVIANNYIVISLAYSAILHKFNIPNYVGGQFNLIKFNDKDDPFASSPYHYVRGAAAALYGSKFIAGIFATGGKYILGAYDESGAIKYKIALDQQVSAIIPKIDFSFKIYWKDSTHQLWSSSYSNDGVLLGTAKSLSCSSSRCDVYYYPIQKDYVYKLAYNITDYDECKTCSISDEDLFSGEGKPPQGLTYTVVLKNGNTLSAMYDGTGSMVYTLKNKNGAYIGKSFTTALYAADLYPIVSYDDSTSMLPCSTGSFYYVEAQAIQSPTPSLEDKEKQSRVQIDRLSSPDLVSTKQPRLLQSVSEQPLALPFVAEYQAQASLASANVPFLTNIFHWIGGMFYGAAPATITGASSDTHGTPSGVYNTQEMRHASQSDPIYAASAVENFALGMVLYRLLFGAKSNTAEILDDEDNVSLIPEEQVAQVITDGEKYLNDCAVKLDGYQQWALLSPQQISETKGLRWAIDEHLLTLQEVKELMADDPYVAAQKLGCLRADIECFRTQFIDLEKWIFDERQEVSLIPSQSLFSANPHIFWHRSELPQTSGIVDVLSLSEAACHDLSSSELRSQMLLSQ